MNQRYWIILFCCIMWTSLDLYAQQSDNNEILDCPNLVEPHVYKRYHYNNSILFNQHSKDCTAPSPSVGSLGLFGQIPVGMYTGTAVIDIPLLDFSYKDISVPISIKYHASGIKPDIVPSPVGLGWTLQAGGFITRVIKGLPDMQKREQKYIHKYNDSERNQKDWPSMQQYGDELNNTQYRFLPSDQSCDPDEFHFNINGQTGKFYLGHDSVFRIQSAQGEYFTVEMHTRDPFYYTFPLLAQVDTASGNNLVSFFGANDYLLRQAPSYKYNRRIHIKTIICGFTMTDSRGVKYQFANTPTDSTYNDAIEFSRVGVYDRNEVDQDSLVERINAMTWRLSKIESPLGNVMTLHYEPEVYVTYKKEYMMYKYSTDEYKGEQGKNVQATLIHGAVLKTIQSPVGYVDFTNSVAKNQLWFRVPPTYAGDSIWRGESYYMRFFHVYDVMWANVCNIPNNYRWLTTDSTINEYYPLKVDRISLYDNCSIKKQVDFTYTDSDSRRLTLLGVKIGDAQGKISPQVYSFGYDYSATDSMRHLPAYLSDQTDHYGYYNGSNACYDDWFKLDSILQDDSTYLDAFRKPDFRYAKAEMLNKVIYPTKGYVTLEYEAHRYHYICGHWTKDTLYVNTDQTADAGGVRIKRITHYDKNDFLLYSTDYRYVRSLKGSEVSSGVLSYRPKYAVWYGPKCLVIHSEIESSANSSQNMGYYEGTNSSCNIGLKQFTYASSLSVSPMQSDMGPHITYSEVEVIKNGYGKTVYHYSNHDQKKYRDKPLLGYITNETADNTGKIGRVPYWEEEPGISMELERGLLLKEVIYDLSSNKQKQIVYTYNNHPNRFNNHVRFVRVNNNDVSLTGYKSQRIVSGVHYTYYPYLQEKNTTYYYGQDSIMEYEHYMHDNQYRLLLQEKQNCSNGDSIRRILTYPIHVSNAVYDAMKQRHLYNYPLYTEKYINDKQTERLENHYKWWGALCVMSKQQYIAEEQDTTIISNVLSFDNVGNPQEVMDVTGVLTTYVWHHNTTYPALVAKGLTYKEIVDCLGDDMLNGLRTKRFEHAPKLYQSRSKLPCYIDWIYPHEDFVAIYTKLSQEYPQTIISMYLIDPLENNLLCEITPNGEKIYYTYDAFNRLVEKYIYQNGEKTVLEAHDYHYAE